MLKHFVCDVPDLQEVLDGLTEGSEIVGLCYASDTGQVVGIVKEAKSFLKDLKKKVSEGEKEEEE